jgi:hypothetical protein
MVARIYPPGQLKRSLNYNENKVRIMKAECLYAGNFLLEKDQMNFYHKLNFFESRSVLNQRTGNAGLHISLNFDPSEQLGRQKLVNIANEYLGKIGFGNQPYLVYEHYDAGHPHLHLVTTLIKEDGKRIDIHNLGRDASERARKELEISYNLVRASGKGKGQTSRLEPVHVQRVQYGKSETKRSITNVLDEVIPKFKYTSLAELNAILKQYNVVGDRGSEGGRIFKNNGLLFKILDVNGNKVGVPIKASSIYSKPTLKNLEKRFGENKAKRQPDRKKLVTAIEWSLKKAPISIEEFLRHLKKEGIQAVLRQSKGGLIYGITFIDYRTMSVFNGSDLGKTYSATNLLRRIEEPSIKMETDQGKIISRSENRNHDLGKQTKMERGNIEDQEKSFNKDDLLQVLLKSERTESRLPYQLLQKRRKKKKRLEL